MIDAGRNIGDGRRRFLTNGKTLWEDEKRGRISMLGRAEDRMRPPSPIKLHRPNETGAYDPSFRNGFNPERVQPGSRERVQPGTGTSDGRRRSLSPPRRRGPANAIAGSYREVSAVTAEMEQDAIQHRLRNPEYGHGAGPSLGNAVIGRGGSRSPPPSQLPPARRPRGRISVSQMEPAGQAQRSQFAAELHHSPQNVSAMHLEHGKFDNPRPELRSVVAESLHWVDADAARQFRDPSRDASPALPRESRPHPLGPEAANGGDTVAMEMFQGGIKKDYPAAVPERNPDGEPYPLPVGPPIKSYSGMRIFEPASRAREAYILRPQSQERRPPWPPNGASGYHASIRVYPQPGPTKVSDATGLDGGLQRVEGRSDGAAPARWDNGLLASQASQAKPRHGRRALHHSTATPWVPAHEGEVDRALFSGQWGEEDPEMRAAAQAHADQWNRLAGGAGGGRDPPYAPDPSPPPTATRGTAPSPSKLRVTALHAPPLNGPRGSREHRRARENFD